MFLSKLFIMLCILLLSKINKLFLIYLLSQYKRKSNTIDLFKKSFYFVLVNFSPKGEWAVPGGTARPGQPVEKSEQAPASSPQFKNQFNIDGPQWGPYQILS